MRTVARVFQLAGLTVPPMAMVAQLSKSISLSQMLGFLVVSICLFLVGYLLQQYSGSA